MDITTNYNVGEVVFLRREATNGVMCQGTIKEIVIEIDTYGIRVIKYFLEKCLGFPPIEGYYYETELCRNSEAIVFVNTYHENMKAYHTSKVIPIDGSDAK